MNGRGYALITGASGGIGECFARALGARGQNLILVARSRDKLESLAEEVGKRNQVAAETMGFDLSEAGAAARLVEALGERKLEIDLLVNNAGFGARGRFWELPVERQSEMMRLNIQALVELTYLVLPRMVGGRQGAIVNVSSTASFQPVGYTSVYAATKAFVTSFSMGLAEELRPYGVKVVTLCPGGTATNFFEAGGYGMRKVPGGLQPPEEVVAAALRALDGGGGLVVPRLVNKLSIASQRLAPRGLVAKFAARIFRV